MAANPEFFELFDDFMAFHGEPKWKNGRGAESFYQDMLYLIELEYVSDAHLVDAERKIMSGYIPE